MPSLLIIAQGSRRAASNDEVRQLADQVRSQAGAPMFAVHMTLGIPADAHIATLRGDFPDYCDDQNHDATFEPVRM